MKFYGSLLALCALQSNLWVTTAFTVVPNKKILKPSVALHSTPTPPLPGPPELSGLPSGVPSTSWDLPKISPIARVEGKTRRTWHFNDLSRDSIQVAMSTEGRPMNADIELWIGPDWTPFTLKAYSQDGQLRPIQTLVGTRNKECKIEVRNTGQYELPLNAAASYAPPNLADVKDKIAEKSESRKIQGGAVYSVPFEPGVEQVQVLLNTETRQLNARVELLNGPNNIKQNFEVFTNNGLLNSLYVVFNTPGSGNVVRIVNLAPVEFPCNAFITAA